jgi:hypothetical protein
MPKSNGNLAEDGTKVDERRQQSLYNNRMLEREGDMKCWVAIKVKLSRIASHFVDIQLLRLSKKKSTKWNTEKRVTIHATMPAQLKRVSYFFRYEPRIKFKSCLSFARERYLRCLIRHKATMVSIFVQDSKCSCVFFSNGFLRIAVALHQHIWLTWSACIIVNTIKFD